MSEVYLSFHINDSYKKFFFSSSPLWLIFGIAYLVNL